MLKRLLLTAMLAATAMAATPAAFADKPPVYRNFGSDLAVAGYDPVAYFNDGKPVAGSKDFTYEYKGATWRFASAANLAAFKAAPDKYAPQYGGYCAWAVSQGYTAKGDPKFWKIVDGKLYLNYDAGVQKKWEQDIPGFIGKANGNWPKVLDK